jgi:L,D-transpeptidase ErfK/SrfK
MISYTDNSQHKAERLFQCRWLRLAQGGFSLALLLAFNTNVAATTFAMPKEGDGLIDSHGGKPKFVKAKQEDTLIDIAVDHLLGQEEIVLANKKVDRWLPRAGTQVRIPTTHLLPDAPHQGIVINLPEYRLYYYVPNRSAKKSPSPAVAKPLNESSAALPMLLNTAPEAAQAEKPKPEKPIALPPTQVITYAVGIGRYDWKTPLGVTSIVAKIKNPTWTPPASIKAEHLAKGDPLLDVYPAGPDNPLGLFAMRLGISGYLLHSTNKPQGVGMQVSHGCMRLYPKDIERLFPIVEVGTSVMIINQPVKVGWSKGVLYVESHPILDGESLSYQERLDKTNALIDKATAQNPQAIDQEALKNALEDSTGIPVAISLNETPAEPTLPEIPDLPDLASSDSDAEAELPSLSVPPKLLNSSAPKKLKPAPIAVKKIADKVPIKPKAALPTLPSLPKNLSKNTDGATTKANSARVFKNSPFPSPN